MRTVLSLIFAFLYPQLERKYRKEKRYEQSILGGGRGVEAALLG